MIGGFDYVIEWGSKKFLRLNIFSRDADCQLGGGRSQENLSIVSARGGPLNYSLLLSNYALHTLMRVTQANIVDYSKG